MKTEEKTIQDNLGADHEAQSLSYFLQGKGDILPLCVMIKMIIKIDQLLLLLAFQYLIIIILKK